MAEADTVLNNEGEGASNDAANTEFNFREHLSDDYKEKFPEMKDVTSIFKSYENLVSKMGQNPIVKPKDDATDEQKAEYTSMLRKELGAPESIDAYDFKLSEDLPEGFVNEDLLGGMKDIFLEHGVPAEAAQKIVETYFEKQLEAFNEGNQSIEEAKETAVQTLKDEWKGDFEGNVNKAKAFAERNYSKETIEKFGNDPAFIKDTLNLYNATSGDKIDNLSGEVKQTPADLRAEARTIMESDEYRNAMSPNNATLVTRVQDLYKRAAETK